MTNTADPDQLASEDLNLQFAKAWCISVQLDQGKELEKFCLITVVTLNIVTQSLLIMLIPKPERVHI